MEGAKNTIKNLPWKKIAIGSGIGIAGVLVGLYAFNRCAKQSAQQQQQKQIASQQKAQQAQKQIAAQQQTQQKQIAAQQQAIQQQQVAAQQQAIQQQQVAAQQQAIQQQMAQQQVDQQQQQLQQVGQIEYHNWNAGNKPAAMGHGYADVSNYYRYNPTGSELPSLHQQESRLMSEGYGTAQFIHEEKEDEMKIGDLNIGNQVQPRNNTNIGAVVMDASLDINPIIPPTGEGEPGQMDNFWQNEGPLNFQEQQL